MIASTRTPRISIQGTSAPARRTTSIRTRTPRWTSNFSLMR